MNLIALLFAVLGLVLLVTALVRLKRRRWLKAGGNGLLGLVLLSLSLLLLAVAANLHTYRRLTHEQEVAQLSFQRMTPQEYRVTVEYPQGREAEQYVLQGDDWQLDVRVMKWHGYAHLLGFDTRYRLERLSGRYTNLESEKTEPRTLYPLAEDSGLDLWALARRYRRWFPWADAVYGSATYLPMSDRARFQVSLTQSGLVARPMNEAAQRAIGDWHW